jgi:hypothetical protein
MSVENFDDLIEALRRETEAQCHEAREELRRIRADDPERKAKAQKVVARLHLAAERLEAALSAFEAKKSGNA